ncbi:MAG: hypothetical protein KDC47_10050, partial [Flavobacteriaceae bacterium]|nr:hypothetical protein [Flavobacteriaceae bacterium]
MTKFTYYIYSILLLSFFLSACVQKNKLVKIEKEKVITQLSDKTKKVRDYVMKDAIIAHRGSTYWTPEETEPAYRWARNIGADYLEMDIQITKDKQLVAFHDDQLVRTTNVSELFPDRANAEISDFTLKELRSLDVGSWFNTLNPDRARPSYKGLRILTLKDIIMIAEGNRIMRKNGEPVKEIIDGGWTGHYLHENDRDDNGHRPGIYIET